MPELTLSVEKDPMRRPHLWHARKDCTRENCPVCDGGLALCKICGGLEGALLDSCPGVMLRQAQHDWNYKKFLTFRADGPTTQRTYRMKL